VNVQEEVDPGLVHFGQHGMDLRRSLERRRLVVVVHGGPFSILVGADRIRPKVSENGSVGTLRACERGRRLLGKRASIEMATITAHGAYHAWNYVQTIPFQHDLGRIVQRSVGTDPQQTMQEPLREKLGHRLAWMLTMLDPSSQFPIPDGDTFYFAPFQSSSERFDGGIVVAENPSLRGDLGGAIGDQLEMTVVGVGRPVREERGSVDRVNL